jgi:hypothetical protein
VAFERLEPRAAKVACAVLMGLGGGNISWLPGQLDIESRDKAALLLGILLDVVADFAPTPQQEERWRNAGIRQLKIAAINKEASK